MKDLDPDDLVALNISTENLILEGIRRTRSWSRVLRGIGGDIDSVPVPTGNTEVLYKLELTDEEQEILSHVNGRATVEQICQVSYLTNFETCRILWAFKVLGVIRRGPGGEPAARERGPRSASRSSTSRSIVEKFNQMFGRVYTFLRGRIGDEVDAFMDEALEQASRGSTAALLRRGPEAVRPRGLRPDAGERGRPARGRAAAADGGGPQRAGGRRSSSACAQRLGAQEKRSSRA